MDNFMDKIAQKLSAQEVIRANAAADAAQLEKLQAQAAEYDACMKEMRKLNLKNAENEQKLQDLMQQLFKENSRQMQDLTEECSVRIRAFQDEKDKDAQTEAILREMKQVSDERMAKLEELFRQADDFVHKENVKVYRNVQAVIVEELEKQTQALRDAEQAGGVRGRDLSTRITGIATLVIAAANMGVLIVHLLGVF